MQRLTWLSMAPLFLLRSPQILDSIPSSTLQPPTILLNMALQAIILLSMLLREVIIPAMLLPGIMHPMAHMVVEGTMPHMVAPMPIPHHMVGMVEALTRPLLLRHMELQHQQTTTKREFVQTSGDIDMSTFLKIAFSSAM